jgi:hypothetical protein
VTLRRSPLCLAIIAVAAAACSDAGSGSANGVVVEREMIGDTTVVRTVAGSAWADTARLVEDLRIGALDGREEVTFGRISQMAVGPDGSIFVFDDPATAIRQFDSTGAFVRTLGRRGQGPGEHRLVLGMAVLSDGRLATYDVQNQRLNLYSSSDGASDGLALRTDATPIYGESFAVDTADRIHVLVGLRGAQARDRGRPAFLRVTLGDSTIDTLPLPTWPERPRSVRLSPRGQWAMHPHGYFVAGMNDRYSFDLLRPTGGVLRIERSKGPPDFVPEERAEWEAELAAADPDILAMEISRGKAPVITYGDKPTLASVKPVYQSITAAADGRIWVRLHTRAVKTEPSTIEPPRPVVPGQKPAPPARLWREPVVYDVFEPDGRYLGPVTVPDRVTPFVMRGDRVWGTAKGESDEEYIVRYRISVSPPS